MKLQDIIQALCRRVIHESEELTRLDQAIGDGDFGTNAKRGAQAVLRAMDQLGNSITTEKLLFEIGKRLNAAGCGTAGTLISFGIMAGAKRGDELAMFLEAALNRIQGSGKAQLGEKTLVDALAPAVEAIKKGCTLEEAAEAAKEGSEQTRYMMGTKGRSLYSQSRAKGIPDPGAYLVAALFAEAVRCQEGVGE